MVDLVTGIVRPPGCTSDSPMMYFDQVVGWVYQYNDGIKAEVYAREESMRMRLVLLGFVEDENEPNTYWLKNKEATDG